MGGTDLDSTAVTSQASVSNGVEIGWSRWLTAVLVAGLVPRLIVPFLSQDRLLGVVADDAGYYLQLAGEATRSGVPSMDGLHATNGFHPLWLVVVTPVARLVADPTMQLRIAALLGVACAAITFVVLARLLVPRVGVAPAAVGLGLWWLSPEALYSSASGLEASLTGLLVVLLVCAAYRYRDRLDVPSAVLVGLCAAGVYLARSDAALAVIGIGGWLVAAVWRRSRPHRMVWRDVGVAGSVAVAVCLPWWCWNIVMFGTVEQASAWSVPSVLWRRSAVTASGSKVMFGLHSAWQFMTGQGPRWLGVPLWLIVLLLVASTWMLVRRTGTAEARGVLALGLWLVAAGAVLSVLHAGVRLNPRPYYFEWVRLAWAILAAGTIRVILGSRVWATPGSSIARMPQRVATTIGALVIAVAGCSLLVNAAEVPVYPWQTSMVAAARWLRSDTDPADRVGSFNSGLLSLYSDRTVVNLDGVADNDAADAVGTSRLAAFVCDQHLAWLVDVAPQFYELYEPALGDRAAAWHLEEVRTFLGDRDVQRRNEVTLFRSSCTR